jgi:hypothetical protein
MIPNPALRRGVCTGSMPAMTPLWTSFAVAVVAIMASGCATNSPTRANPGTGEVRISNVAVRRTNDYWSAELAITNALPHSVWFFGYSIDSPIYQVQYFKDGLWTNSLLGWCGTGVEMRELQSHTSVKFTVLSILDKSKKAMRVGVACYSTQDYRNEVAKIYWSEDVRLKR